MTLVLKNWRYEIDVYNIAWATFDKVNAAINTLDHATLMELDRIITHTATSLTTLGLVICSSKPSGFIAGADIAQFQSCQDPEEGLQQVLYGQQVLARLEKMTKPTLALISGVCLGGGFELALACRYRIATNDATTALGLPEIKLGLHPGWGGSIRLPRLVGALQALPLILSGESLSADQAGRLHIVDYVLPQRACHHAAQVILRDGNALQNIKLSPALGQRFLSCLTKLYVVRFLIAHFMRKKISKKIIMQHYPAIEALLTQWQHYGFGKQAYAYEAASLVALFSTPTAQNLIRLFLLQTALKATGKNTSCTVQHVHVIGAGTMGGDIAAWCALHGFQVTLQDRDATLIAPAILRAQKLFIKKLKLKHLVQAANDHLIPDVEGQGISHADIIIEAIYENLAAKQSVLKTMEKYAKPSAIFATNTSSIALDNMNSVLADPSRLVGIHFFNPVSMMQLVEVVQGQQTTPAILHQACAFVTQIKRLPLQVKSRPGFLINRILLPYLMESVMLFEEGVALEKIDQVAIQFGMPMGPIALADAIGLDICLSVAQELIQVYGGTVPKILQQKVSQKHLGVKTSQGFYTYQKGEKKRSIFSGTLTLPDEDIIDRLIYRILNESQRCLAQGIVGDADSLDAGMVFGAGFAPFRGGPMQYMKTIGITQVQQRFAALQEKYGTRFS